MDRKDHSEICTDFISQNSCCCSSLEAPESPSLHHSTPLESLKAPPKDKSGYECEFVQPPPTLVQSECSICLQILRKPHLISCCGHNYCGFCIDHVIKNGTPCPLCNKESFTVLHNKGLQRSLNALKVTCSNVKLGCDWTGELGQFDAHLNENPDTSTQVIGCQYVEVECRHSCGQKFLRHTIDVHQMEHCPQRPFCCDYCRNYTSIHADVVYRHWPMCNKYPLSCPNHCTVYAIERESLAEHLETECPLKMVDCEFQSAGCETQVQRQDMPDHLEQCHVQHTSMLAAMSQKLADDLVEKDEEISRISVDFETKIAQVKTDTHHEIASLRQENADLKRELAQTRSEMTVLAQTLQGSLSMLKQNQEVKQKELSEKHDKTHQEITNLSTHFSQTKLSLSNQCYSIQAYVGLFPIEFSMPDFTSHKQQRRDWESPPFYSHLEGYRICLLVNAHGCGSAMGLYVSVYVCLMRGEFDDHLKWPFRGVITVQLLNQLGERNHATGTIRFTDITPTLYTSRVVVGDRAKKGWGQLRFIGHSELGFDSVKNRQYLKDDCLKFRVSRIELLP